MEMNHVSEESFEPDFHDSIEQEYRKTSEEDEQVDPLYKLGLAAKGSQRPSSCYFVP